MKFNIWNSEFLYLYYLTRGFIASTRAFNLLIRAFILPARAFTLATDAFSLLACGFELTHDACFTFPLNCFVLKHVHM